MSPKRFHDERRPNGACLCSRASTFGFPDCLGIYDAVLEAGCPGSCIAAPRSPSVSPSVRVLHQNSEYCGSHVIFEMFHTHFEAFGRLDLDNYRLEFKICEYFSVTVQVINIKLLKKHEWMKIEYMEVQRLIKSSGYGFTHSIVIVATVTVNIFIISFNRMVQILIIKDYNKQ